MFKAAVLLTCMFLGALMVVPADATGTKVVQPPLIAAPPAKPLTPEAMAAQKMKDAVDAAKKLCAQEKLVLLHSFIKDLKSLEGVREKWEAQRNSAMEEQH